jgi:RNA polymerase sigma factor (sigma-70 family)
MSADLIVQIREQPNSQRRWAAWYKRVYPNVYYAAFRLTNGNAEEARELTQETFTRFLEYRAIERVQGEQHALGYLIKTCRNLAIDRNARVREIRLESLIEADSIPAPERHIEESIDLDRALLELGGDDQMLTQWMREGISVSEIARRLGITYTAAGVRIHRLRKRLREAIGQG